MNQLSIFDTTIISRIQEQYDAFAEEDLIQAEQCGAISLIEFVVAQRSLFSDFKDYLMTQQQNVFTVADVQKFLDREDLILASIMTC